MKILIINTVCGIGSTGRICTDLADVLEQNGHECKIAYGRGVVPEKLKKYAIRIGSDIDVKLHALQTRLFDCSGFGSQRATEKFIEWVKEYNPDIVHLHNLHGYYINIELLFNYLAETNKPVVWTLHDCWSFTGHCAYYSYAMCDKWKNGCHSCPQKKKYPSSWLFDRSQKNWLQKKKLFTSVKNMTLVVPSQWLAKEIQQSFLRKYPIKVIPNGIDLDVFKPTISDFRKNYNLEGKKIILGVASIWEPRKGLNDFIELSKILDDSYKIILVGLTENQKRKLPKEILCLTRTCDIKKLAEIYSAADVFFNPSKEETMGLTTVEAMACGTPSIVFNSTAIPEVINKECGIVLDKLDCITIKEKIDSLDLNENSIIKNSRKFEKKFQYLEYNLLYKTLYEQVMSFL